MQDSTGAILTSSYDALSRRTLLQEAAGQRTTYTYLNTLVDIDVTGPGVVKMRDHLDTLGRFSYSQLLNVTPGLIQGLHYYDAAGRFYRRVNYLVTTPTTYLVDSPGTLDRVGNITLINEVNTTGARTTFSYDNANQLLTEWRDVLDAYRVTYTYDGLGNRLTAVESAGARTTSVYDGANQLLTAQTGAVITTYSYDGNGNQTGQNALGALTTFVWDEENRLTGIAYPTGALSTYVYSADGLRRKREESGVSLLEVWDGTQLLQEKDSSTKAEVTRYLLQNDSYSGLRAQRQASDGVWRYFAYDVQGSTRKLLNSDGTSALDLLYRAFGQKQASSGVGQTLMQFGAFYGYEWDADSRMWVKARHLSGTQGRWLNQDPIGFKGGDWNIQRYAANNPLKWFDPFGLITCNTLVWLRNDFQSKSGDERRLAIKRFYFGIAAFLGQHGYTTAQGNFQRWLSGVGGTKTIPNIQFQRDRRTQERMAEIKQRLIDALEVTACQGDSSHQLRCPSGHKHCVNISVWPSTTDLDAAVGRYSLNSNLDCYAVNGQLDCTITWWASDVFDWNPLAIVPGIPYCRELGIVQDNWALEIEGRGAKKFNVITPPWTEHFTLPCPKIATGSGCPQGKDPITMPDDAPPGSGPLDR